MKRGLKNRKWFVCLFMGMFGLYKIYINGELRGSVQGVMKKSTRKWAAIGASSSRGSAYGFNGIISDVKLFDKVLTDAEIAEMKPEM